MQTHSRASSICLEFWVFYMDLFKGFWISFEGIAVLELTWWAMRKDFHIALIEQVPTSSSLPCDIKQRILTNIVKFQNEPRTRQWLLPLSLQKSPHVLEVWNLPVVPTGSLNTSEFVLIHP